MGLTDKEKKFVLLALLLLIISFTVISFLGLKQRPTVRAVDFLPKQSISIPEQSETCADGVCQEGERVSCYVDCSQALVQTDGSQKLILDEDSPALRQTFIPTGENSSLSYMRFEFFDTVRKPFNLKIYKEGSPESVLFERDFYMPGLQTQYFQIFEGEEIETPLEAGEVHVLEIRATEGAAATFLRSQSSTAYSEGKLSLFGVTRDTTGEIVDPEQRWIELDSDLQLTLFFWTDRRTDIIEE